MMKTFFVFVIILLIGFAFGAIIQSIFFDYSFDAYFGNRWVNFQSYDDAKLVCDLVNGTMYCGPKCTCNLEGNTT